ncbi:MAG TPA: DUF6265 family protein [Gemmatimonadales bacterium]|nr:DUF6265 family protein [Gemmatimonadales bacterium]
MILPLRLLALAAVVLVPATAAPPAPGPLEPLRFMAGCWRGQSGDDRVIEEHYTSPSANLILGMTRYTRNGVATGYEFSTIAWKDSAIVLTPRPEGQQPVPFPLAQMDRSSAVWENPAHDFPTRIAYRRVPGDTLVARVAGPGEGGAMASEEWRMVRVRCED